MRNNVAMQTETRLQLFLRIKHRSLDPHQITAEMNLEPEYAVRAGEALSSRGKQTVHSESYWIAKLSISALPISIAPDDLTDYVSDFRDLLSTASVAKKISLHARHFEKAAYLYQGLSKAEVLETIGASPIEMVLVPWLRRFSAQAEFIKTINADSGAVTLIVQLRKAEHPLRIRPTLSRRLADTGIELEMDCSA